MKYLLLASFSQCEILWTSVKRIYVSPCPLKAACFMRLCLVEVPWEQRPLIRGMWFSKASIHREKVVSSRRKRRRRSLSINNKTPDGVYAGCVGVSKNYVEWHWKVGQCINNKCVQERRRSSVKYTRRWVTHKGSFAPQNKTYINITTIYVKSVG